MSYFYVYFIGNIFLSFLLVCLSLHYGFLKQMHRLIDCVFTYENSRLTTLQLLQTFKLVSCFLFLFRRY